MVALPIESHFPLQNAISPGLFDPIGGYSRNSALFQTDPAGMMLAP
jgi:hypothetical protein